jgi:opacity protein-like surface antigen
VARLNVMVLLGGMACGVASPGFAADLGPSPMLPPAPMLDYGEGVAEVGNGWYLRGDIGYVDYNRVRDIPFGPPGTTSLIGERVKNAVSFGGGIGYQLTNMLRADVTIDHRLGASYSGTRPDPIYTIRDDADLESTTYLLNGYIDLGTWSGITPYVGAGVGAASNRFTNVTREISLDNTFVGRIDLPRYTSANFAWALMAGVAADLGSGFKIDLGYRYTRLGDAHTRLDGLQAGIRTKDMDAHEFRIGARYMIE